MSNGIHVPFRLIWGLKWKISHMAEILAQGKINVELQHIDKRYARVEINISNLSWKSSAFDGVTPLKRSLMDYSASPQYRRRLMILAPSPTTIFGSSHWGLKASNLNQSRLNITEWALLAFRFCACILFTPYLWITSSYQEERAISSHIFQPSAQELPRARSMMFHV